MTPLHRRAEDALTELARVDCRLVQGDLTPSTFNRLRAARAELEAILREARVIPSGQVRPHWLEQDRPPGIASLDAYRNRAREEWR